MAVTNLNTSPIFASTDSRVSDGSTTSAGTGSPTGAQMAIGGANGANGSYALLRFDTAALTPASMIFSELALRVNVASANTPTAATVVLASWFGSGTPANADYRPNPNQAATDTSKWEPAGEHGAPSTSIMSYDISNPLFLIGQLAAANVALTLDQELSIRIPAWVLAQEGRTFTDLEIRPDVAGVPAAGNLLTIYGPAEATKTTLRPRITGYAIPYADITDDYRYPGDGEEQILAVGIETKHGQPVKPSIILPLVDTDMAGAYENIVSRAVSQYRTQPERAAVGASVAAGSHQLEMTPERAVALLLGFFSIYATTDLGAVDGVQTYMHEFRVARRNATASFTFLRQIGDFAYVHRGSKLSRMSISSALDQAVAFAVDHIALEEWIYDNSAGGANWGHVLDSAAAKDSFANGFQTFTDVTISNNGNRFRPEDVTDLALTISQGSSMKRGHDRKRHGQKIRSGGLAVGVGFTSEMSHELIMQAQSGNDRTHGVQRGGMYVTFDELRIALIGILGEDNQKLEFVLPKFQMVAAPRDYGRGAVTSHRVTGEAYTDATISGSARAYLTCSHPASFFQPSTNLITVRPPNPFRS